MALMDTLNQIRNRKQTPQPQGMGGELADIARAKTAGAKQSSGPGASRLGEQRQAAMGQTQQAQQQVGANIEAGKIQQGAEQQEQALATQKAGQQQQFKDAIAGISTQANIGAQQRQSKESMVTDKMASTGRMQTDQIMNNYNNTLDKISTQMGMQRDDLFRNFQNSNKDLASRKDAAELEQLGHIYSMQDQSYLDYLNRVARENNLEDELAFKEETNRIMLGNNMNTALKNSGLQIELAQNDAALAEELKTIDLDTALAISRAAAADQATSSIIEGGGKIAQSAATYKPKGDK